MIELREDTLEFSFPQVHPAARMRVHFHRTLRLPDDGEVHWLPAGLGSFPLRHVDDMRGPLPERWRKNGGVVLPMYTAEALWLSFEAEYAAEHDASYPFAVQVCAGRINAATGQAWRDELGTAPQDYLVVPTQPWIDGFCVDKGVVRQFVAMPLGAGYTAEEQVTGRSEHGGLQIAVRPMKREAFEQRFPKLSPAERRERASLAGEGVCYSSAPDMGLGAGGQIRQELYEDPFSFDDWSTETRSRCIVHLCNAMVWRALEGSDPPSPPVTSWEYERAGLPWFDWYDDAHTAIDASEVLRALSSVSEVAAQKGEATLPGDAPVDPGLDRVVPVGPGRRPG